MNIKGKGDIFRYVKRKTAIKKLFAFIDLRKNPLVPFIEDGCPILNFGVYSDNTNATVKKKVKAMIEAAMIFLLML